MIGAPSSNNQQKGSVGVFVGLTADGTPDPGPTMPPNDPNTEPMTPEPTQAAFIPEPTPASTPESTHDPTDPPTTLPTDPTNLPTIPTNSHTDPPSSDSSTPPRGISSSCTGTVRRCGSNFGQSECNAISGCSWQLQFCYQGVCTPTGCYGSPKPCSYFDNNSREGCINQNDCLWSGGGGGSGANGREFDKKAMIGLIVGAAVGSIMFI